MECTFKVGDKVVCVDDTSESTISWLKSIKRGETYTVRWVGVRGKTGSICVRLEGVRRMNFSGEDVPLLASRFRPIVSRSTDKGMSILRGLLDKADKPVKVTA